MKTMSSIKSQLPVQGGSLVDTVSRLCTEFSAIQKELEDARSENDKLKNELKRWRSKWNTLPRVDTSSLRRSVAFFVHPDKGGDTEIMSKLNVIFDFINGIEAPQKAVGDAH